MALKILIFLFIFIGIFIIPFKKTQAVRNIIFTTILLTTFCVIIFLTILGFKLFEDPNWFRHFLFWRIYE